jgi:hypothetical protein
LFTAPARRLKNIAGMFEWFVPWPLDWIAAGFANWELFQEGLISMKNSPTYTVRLFKLTLVLLCAVSLLSVTALISARQWGAAKVKSDAVTREPANSRLMPEQARETYGQIPLSFETNQGQTESSVNFLARGAGYSLFLKPTEAVFQLQSADSGLRNQDSAGSTKPDALVSPDSPHSPIRNSSAETLARLSQALTKRLGRSTTSLETIRRSGGRMFRRSRACVTRKFIRA